MNKNTKIFIFLVIGIVVLAGGIIFFSSRGNSSGQNNTAQTETDGTVAGTSTTDQSENYDNAYIEKLAKFMTGKGMVLYGAYWCPHCQDQKAMFGDALKYIDYVECDAGGPNANPDECVAQGIEGYPTWVYQGKKYSGTKSLSDLAKIVGFSETAGN